MDTYRISISTSDLIIIPEWEVLLTFFLLPVHENIRNNTNICMAAISPHSSFRKETHHEMNDFRINLFYKIESVLSALVCLSNVWVPELIDTISRCVKIRLWNHLLIFKILVCNAPHNLSIFYISNAHPSFDAGKTANMSHGNKSQVYFYSIIVFRVKIDALGPHRNVFLA